MPSLTPYLEWGIQLTPSVTPSAVTDTDPIVLPYGFVKPLETELTAVDLQAPVRDTLLDYATRDAELGHRDLVAGVLAAKLLYAVAGAWGVNVQKLIIPFQPDSDPVYSATDQKYDLYARITHLTGADVVADALRVDKECYNRDHLIYRAVNDIAAALDAEVRPTAYTSGSTAGLYWSPGSGLVSTHTVSFRAWGQSLFNDPDKNLAYRDDVIARAVAVAGRIIREGYQHVTRVSAAIWENGIKTRENETYVKVSEDSRYVDFAAFPRIPGANLLRYDKKANRIQYVHAGGPTFGTGPFIPVGKSGGWLDATSATFTELPYEQRISVAAGGAQPSDSAFWAQKAGQVIVSPNAEVSTLVLEGSAATSAAHQVNPQTGLDQAVLRRRSQVMRFVIPAWVPAGTYAVYVDFTPGGARTAPLVPLYVKRAPTGSDDTLHASYAEVATYPNRRDVVPAAYLRSAAEEESIYVGIDYPHTDAEYSTVHTEGSDARSAGASFTSNPYSSDAAWQRRAWRDGFYTRDVNPFSKDTVLYVNRVELRLRYATRVTPNIAGLQGVKAECLNRAVTAVRAAYSLDIAEPVVMPVFETLIGVPGRAITPYGFRAQNDDAGRFAVDNDDILHVTGYSDADDYVPGAQLVLWPTKAGVLPGIATVASVDYRDGALRVTLTAPLAYSGSGTVVPKRRAFRFALSGTPVGLVIDENTGVMTGIVPYGTAAGPLEFRVIAAAENIVISSTPATMNVVNTSPGYDYAWDARSTESWMELLANGREPRIRTAFRVGLPGDVGRPALVPSGIRLERDGSISSFFRTPQSEPVLSAFEPWMMDAGVYVCADSFWSPPQAVTRTLGTGTKRGYTDIAATDDVIVDGPLANVRILRP